MDLDQGSIFYIFVRLSLSLGHRLLPDAVYAKDDLVPRPAGRNVYSAAFAVQNERHGHDGFQGVALRPRVVARVVVLDHRLARRSPVPRG